MQPNSRRRVHSAEFKAKVLEQCRQPGASVAAVALSHGLNVNLVRKWLVGRGLKRAGLATAKAKPKTEPVSRVVANRVVSPTPALRFVPVDLAPSRVGGDEVGRRAEPVPRGDGGIQIELRRGDAQLTVRWPSSQASACANWLSEFAARALK